jgi:hypothetical protein
MPRLGIIHLGEKKRSQKGVEYPTATPYFVCPPSVESIVGKNPTELTIMFPVEDEGLFFRQSLRIYKSDHTMLCEGDGVVAMRRNEKGQWVERGCWQEEKCEHHESKKCSPKATLLFILPDVNMAGVYQITTGSVNNIIELNSTSDHLRSLVGRICFMRLKLVRVEKECSYFDEKEQKQKTKKMLFVDLKPAFPCDMESIMKLRDVNTDRITYAKQVLLPDLRREEELIEYDPSTPEVPEEEKLHDDDVVDVEHEPVLASEVLEKVVEEDAYEKQLEATWGRIVSSCKTAFSGLERKEYSIASNKILNVFFGTVKKEEVLAQDIEKLMSSELLIQGVLEDKENIARLAKGQNPII